VSTISRSQRLALPVALIAALLLLVPAAFAAKGGGGGKPSGGGSTSGITGPTMVYDANSSGTPNWGDEIAFTTSTSWTLYPSIEVTCSQNGTAVYRTAPARPSRRRASQSPASRPKTHAALSEGGHKRGRPLSLGRSDNDGDGSLSRGSYPAGKAPITLATTEIPYGYAAAYTMEVPA
jgi:hypothetical protein